MHMTIIFGLALVVAGGLAWHALMRWHGRMRRASGFLAAVVDASTAVSIIATDTRGLITLFNSGAERMLGYSAGEMVGLRTPVCFHDEDEMREQGRLLSRQVGREIAGFDVFVEAARRGGHETCVWTYIRKSGERLQVSLTVTAIQDGQGALCGFLGVATDISPIKALEDELGISQLRFFNTFQGAAHGMALVSLEGAWLDVNPALCDMLGYSRDELLSKDFQSITHPEDLSDDLALLNEVLAGRRNGYQLEKRYYHRDGRVIHVLLSVSLVRDQQEAPRYFVSQIQDVTARRLAEDALRESENYLRTIMDNVVDAIITIDEQGRIESFNHAAERMFGHAEHELIGRDIAMLMPEPYSSQHGGYLRRYHDTGVPRVIGVGREVEGLRADGSVFQMELQVSSLVFRGQRQFVGVVRDITVRKRVERMKDEFVSTVSHELRTPLTAISGSLELVAGGVMGELQPAQKEVLDIACRNSTRLGQLINDLLDMDKLVSGKMDLDIRPHALMPLVRDALLLNQGYADQFLVHFELTGALDAMVRVDGARLQQILANYLSNAAKFAPTGSVVKVGVEALGERLRITVTDAGPGIPEGFRDRLFTKFSQIDSSDSRPRSGTGLGLAISKELAERMQGQVGCLCEPERGTIFYVDLPRYVNLGLEQGMDRQ